MIDADDHNVHHFPLPVGVDEIGRNHHGTFDAVRGNIAAASGHGSPFHWLERMRLIFAILLFLITYVAWADSPITLVRVLKSDQKLQLLADGKLVQEFHVVLGGNPKGHKTQEGDKKTPEGLYVLDYKKTDSSFYKAIHISYPNAKDVATAKARGVNPGGQIMIHGQKNKLGWLSFFSQRFNWTNGCVALSNKNMDTVWTLVKVGTPVEILP